MTKWEYMTLYPDSEMHAIHAAGGEGWEAVCAWTEYVTQLPKIGIAVDLGYRTTHILFKRPVIDLADVEEAILGSSALKVLRSP